jgi:hypothetical protein
VGDGVFTGCYHGFDVFYNSFKPWRMSCNQMYGTAWYFHHTTPLFLSAASAVVSATELL